LCRHSGTPHDVGESASLGYWFLFLNIYVILCAKMSAEKTDSSHILVLVTASSGEEAHRIADKLLAERKAACVNIVPGVSSFFWWKGNVDSAKETLLLIKSQQSLLDDVIKLVKANHSCEVPEIIALPIVGGNPDYLEWIETETRKK
jgi:periplasmic divalent cation tolerance protein